MLNNTLTRELTRELNLATEWKGLLRMQIILGGVMSSVNPPKVQRDEILQSLLR
jgi:hypothetical protein